MGKCKLRGRVGKEGISSEGVQLLFQVKHQRTMNPIGIMQHHVPSLPRPHIMFIPLFIKYYIKLMVLHRSTNGQVSATRSLQSKIQKKKGREMDTGRVWSNPKAAIKQHKKQKCSEADQHIPATANISDAKHLQNR